ncbi:hypothetical protein GOOTI_145_00210, partial [Gordonia otitidis NBRC 100426]
MNHSRHDGQQRGLSAGQRPDRPVEVGRQSQRRQFRHRASLDVPVVADGLEVRFVYRSRLDGRDGSPDLFDVQRRGDGLGGVGEGVLGNERDVAGGDGSGGGDEFARDQLQKCRLARAVG